MFVFLFIIGVTSILLGIYLNKKGTSNTIQNGIAKKDLASIKIRLDAVEKILFNTDLEDQISQDDILEDNNLHVDYSEIAKAVMIRNDIEENSMIGINKNNIQISPASLEKYNSICELEDKRYSIEEICKQLSITKGEVLLLKNLHKDS